MAGYLISSGPGLVTFGLKGLAADLASAAVGAVPGAFMGVREVIRRLGGVLHEYQHAA